MSIKAKARLAGVLYLIVIITAGFAEGYVRAKTVVRNDPAATAANITSHELLYRAGGVADAVNFVCDMGLAVLLFALLAPVSRTLAAATALFRFAGDLMGMIITIAHFVPLLLLKNAPYLGVFSAAQVQAQALTFLRLHSQGYNVAMVLFGVHCTLLGYLVIRSEFWPRALGVILSVAGICYVFNSMARLLWPPFAAHFFPYILWPGILAEFALTVWLLALGVDEARWRARASHTDVMLVIPESSARVET
jgi:hypothetical protein